MPPPCRHFLFLQHKLFMSKLQRCDYIKQQNADINRIAIDQQDDRFGSAIPYSVLVQIIIDLENQMASNFVSHSELNI